MARFRLPASGEQPPGGLAPILRLMRHNLLSSRDETEVRRFLDERNFQVDFPADGGADLDAHINGVYLSGMYLGFASYGRAIAIQATARRSDFWLQFPTQRRFEVDIAGQHLLCDMHHGAMLSPTLQSRVRPEPGCARLVLSMSRDALIRQLSALLGRPISTPLTFQSSIRLDQGYGWSLARYIRTAVDDFEQHESLMCGPIARNTFEQFIITALLTSHPHNYSDQLRRADKPPSTRQVRRAIEYIESNLTAPITMADIVAAAGVSGRVLFKHFNRATGTSPMAYLREARFRGVRDDLRRARPEERIVDIAALWGFDHIGRFAIEYRRRFGEKPSETKSSAVPARGRLGRAFEKEESSLLI